MPTKHAVVLACAACLVYLVFLFPSPEFPVSNADDGAWFVTLALNVVEYGRYTVDTFPVEDYGRHATWPSLYPWLVAGWIAVFGVNWLVLKLVMTAFGLAALLLMLRFWRQDRLGFWAVALTALSPTYFLYSHHTMTEVVYMAVLFGALLAVQRSASWKGPSSQGSLVRSPPIPAGMP